MVGTGENLDDSLNTIISEFKLLAQETPVVKPTATHMTLKAHAGRSVNVNNYGRVTAFDLADGVDMVQAQNLSDEQTSYTPDEVGVQVILAGSALRRSADSSLQSRTSTMLNNAWQLKEDSDGCAEFASGIAIGAAGMVISPGHVEAIASRLRIGNNRASPEPVAKPWNAVLYPLSASVLRMRIIPLATTPSGGAAAGVNTGAHLGVSVTVGGMTATQERLLLNGPGSLGQLAGIIVREDANIDVDGSDDAINGFYGREHLVYVNEVSPRMDPDTSDKSMRGAVELNLWGSYVWGTYRADVGIFAGTFDASIPTS